MAGGLAKMSHCPTQVSPSRDLERLPLRISLQPGDCWSVRTGPLEVEVQWRALSTAKGQ